MYIIICSWKDLMSYDTYIIETYLIFQLLSNFFPPVQLAWMLLHNDVISPGQGGTVDLSNNKNIADITRNNRQYKHKKDHFRVIGEAICNKNFIRTEKKSLEIFEYSKQ